MAKKELTKKGMIGGELMNPSEYLCAADLKGKECVLEVDGVRFEDLHRQGSNDKERKPVMTFKGAKKRFVINDTNEKLMVRHFGDPEATNWVGKKLKLYPTTCSAFGQTVDCIRVKPDPQLNSKNGGK